ncbi:vWA domain-containing protein [Bordetella pseudohinzii]|uniref:Mg-chelatase subunit ChlD n=1 Tax=Bordetella pseudohinzii TaxID=1331258 RepID=A0A0J6C3K5_9BORD|nr:VWA domain-containing protein [Bordetella pseudohinzii]ANY16159.1 hypothetical protein BBN53_09780 [Bordetella pseudohinzii]KMM25351.1 membrane protein [Bordetella pseudohinzii]KXA76000.1 hypothetical protein AW878_19030 [Bordetella pseudohinzii]KXA81242.1 hypothetical protein AW877_04755 [Bordetella pseudohinzii]CUJ04278.1 Mg-chelatase subunit ChlD [Bordetella pseudohinzii]
MWQLDYPWLLPLALLALAARRWLPPYPPAQQALRVPFFEAVQRVTGVAPSRPKTRRGQGWLNLLVWLLVLLALARPVRVDPPRTQDQPLRDIMLAVDLSQSMDATDFVDAQGRHQSRLEAVKTVVADFIRRRPQDRLGLIVFGTGAYPQSPPTMDHATLGFLLGEMGVGMAGPHTAIGDAIGLSIRLLQSSPEKEKLLILLTDGNDTGSKVPPDRAAALAAGQHITVHTIGIGDPKATGEDKVDFDVLRAIAKTTGGQFFPAADRQALEQVYATLDRITPHTVQVLKHQARHDFFWVPLGLAMLLLAGWHLVAALAGWRGRREGAWIST